MTQKILRRNFRENYPLFETSKSKLAFAHGFSMPISL